MKIVSMRSAKNRKVLSKQETIDLVRQAQAGDLAARNKLIEKNLGLIVKTIVKHVFDKDLQEDLFADFILVAIDSIKTYREDGGAGFPRYLVRCLAFKALSFTARDSEKIVSLDAPAGNTDEPGQEATMLDTMPDTGDLRETENRELRQTLTAAMDQLDEYDRRILEDSVLHECPIEAIGERLGVSGVYVRQLKNKACAQVRRFLEKDFPECVDQNPDQLPEDRRADPAENIQAAAETDGDTTAIGSNPADLWNAFDPFGLGCQAEPSAAAGSGSEP